MGKPATSNEHKQLLELIYNHLEEDGWDAALQTPDKTNPYHMAVVNIVSDDEKREALWRIELSFLPIPAAELTDVSVLQCFVPLANNFTGLLKPELFEMIAAVNANMPLVGFGFSAEFNLFYYKYNLMLPNAFTDVSGMLLSESLSMITYLISTFTESILEVANGKKSIAEAMKSMRHN